jgi:hypothetical protein
MKIENYCNTCLLLLLLIANPVLIYCQDESASINEIKTSRVNIIDFPFSEVIVLDNRIDTVTLYNFEDGKFPPQSLRFGTGCSSLIKNAIGGATKKFRRGNNQLLINITRLRIANKSVVQRKVGDKALNIGIRRFMMFHADVYVKSNSSFYRKSLVIDRMYGYNAEEEIVSILSNIAKELTESVSFIDKPSLIDSSRLPPKLRYLADSYAFNFIRTESFYTREELNTPVHDTWQDMMIVRPRYIADGVFYSFDDFREARTKPANSAMEYVEDDSLYILQDSTADASKLYATCYNGDLYIRIWSKLFLKLQPLPGKHSFGFYLPQNLPDMYSLLSMENVLYQSGEVSAETGEILPSVLGSFMVTILSEMAKNAQTRMLSETETQKARYRNCFIDMDSGDFIY